MEYVLQAGTVQQEVLGLFHAQQELLTMQRMRRLKPHAYLAAQDTIVEEKIM